MPRRPIAVTMGEPAGIGPEVIINAWLAREAEGLPPFYVVGDPKIFTAFCGTATWCKSFGAVAVAATPPTIDAIVSAPSSLIVHGTALPVDVVPGMPAPGNGPGVVQSIDLATNACLTGQASAVVTAPIQKSNLYDAGFNFPGHTEYLAHLCTKADKAPEPLMLLEGGGLRVALVTIHLPLKDVPAALTQDNIIRKGIILSDGLRSDFGIPAPRIAVAALNPHGGETGQLGREEIETIAPAVEALKASGVDAQGPLPADTLFHESARVRYDAVLCMYHDQALIPLKTLDFKTGVNVTLGLPIVRTSPDHGTALDIAGQGIADPSSLIAAIKTAAAIADEREQALP